VSPLNISDEYLPEVNDWLEDYDLEKENKLNAIESALYELKRTSNKCFEILHRFYYLRHSMKDIASALNYTNDKNAKTQKSKCKKRLEQLSKNQIDRNE